MATYFRYADDNRGQAYFTSGNAGSEAENSPTTNVVYTAHAVVRRHPTKHLSYRLDANVADNNYFTINASTGAVTFKASPDYEGPHDNTYSIVVTASDGKPRHTVKKAVTITVTDVNDHTPVFTSNTTSTTAENVTTTGYTAHATDGDGTSPNNTVHYSLAANVGDNNLFNIDSNTGVVTFKTAPDYEHPADAGGNNVYDVTITATDGGTPARSATQTVHITVTDANDNAPVFASSTGSASEAENTPASTVVYTAHATDADGTSPNNSVTYSLSGTDAGKFDINATSGAVTFKASPDYEAHPAPYQITVVATDGGNPALSSSQAVTITVTDVNDNAPVFTSSATPTVNEGTTAVVTLTTTDADTVGNNPPTYTITGGADAGQFQIVNGNQLEFITAKDYETQAHSYQVQVSANDGTNTTTQVLTVGVADVAPSAPTDINNADNHIAAGSAQGSPTGITASSTDPAGGTVTYSLSNNDGGHFQIDANGVVTAGPVPLTYDSANPANNTRTIVVQASDPSNASSSHSFTITVDPDAPPVVTAGHTLAYSENQAATAIDPAITVTDSDSPSLAGATVQISGNYVSGQDLLGFTDTATIHGTFDPTTGTLTLTGTDTVANYQAALQSVTYQNTSDNPSSAARTVTIIANDGIVGSDPATDTINVTPINDAPTATNLTQSLTIAEDAPATNLFTAAPTVADVDSPTVTATLTLADPTAGVLTGATATATPGVYTITGSPQAVQTALAAVQFDSADNYNGSTSVGVGITDGQNGPQGTNPSGSVSITITPVNDPPTQMVPGAQTTNEDTQAAISGVSVADIDSTNLTTTLSVLHGTVSVTTGGGATITSNGSGTVTVAGTAAQINAALTGLTYTNTADYNGSDTLTVATNDGQYTTTNTVGITVNPVQDAFNDTATTNEDTTVNIDPDGDHNSFENPDHPITAINGHAITVNGQVAVDHGTVTLLGNGTLNYAPAANYNGSDSFSYTVSPAGGTPETANVTVTINPVNDPPTQTAPASASTPEDTGAQISGVSVADIDSPNLTTTLSVQHGTVSVTTGTGATITNNGSGTVTVAGTQAQINDALAGLTYHNTPDYNGSDTLTVSTSDGVAAPVTNTVAITVTPVQDAFNDTATTDEDTTVNINVNANDTFSNSGHMITAINGSAIAEGGTVNVAHGTVTLDSGRLDYTPAANYNGADAFNYTVTSGGVTETANVGVTINSVNDAPSGADKTIAGTGPHTFTTADFGFTDPNDAAGPSGANNLAAVKIDSLPANGTLSYSGTPITQAQVDNGYEVSAADIGNGKLVFNPDTSGNTATFTFQVRDDGGTANNGVDLDPNAHTITLVPDTPPIANADEITATEGGGTNNTGGHDPQGNVVTGTGGNGETADSDAEDPTSSLVVVKAGTGTSPGGGDANVISTGTAIVGSHGTLTIKPDGSYSYVVNQGDSAVNALNPSQTLPDTFHYTIQDSGGLTSTAAINVTIHGANDAPDAYARTMSFTEAGGVANGTPGLGQVTVNLLTGSGADTPVTADSDPDSGDSISLAMITTPAGITVDQVHFTTGSVRYTLDDNNSAVQALRLYSQTLTFTGSYTIQDSSGVQSTANLTFVVHGQNDNPTAVADTSTSPGARPAIEAGGTANGTAGQTGTGNVLTNDTDPDSAANGETKTVQGVVFGSTTATQSSNVGQSINGAYGALVLMSDGSYVYTVDDTKPSVQALQTGQTVTDTFTYTMHDTAGATSTTTLTVSIQGANDAPVAAAGTATGNEDTTITVTLGASDVDDSSGATYTLASLPSNGTLYTNAGLTTAAAAGTAYTSNTFYFKPNANYSGTGTFNFTTTDQHGATSNTATETIDVAPVADQAGTPMFGDFTPTAATSQATISPPANQDLGSPAVSAISGGYVVAYSDYKHDQSAGDIVAQRYDFSGNAVGSPIHVSNNIATANSIFLDDQANVAKLPNGGFLVAFTRSLDVQNNTQSVIVKLFDANGNATSGEITVANGSGNSSTGKAYSNASATVLSDGKFVVMYQAQPYGGNGINGGAVSNVHNDDFYGQLYSAAGTPIGTAFHPTAVNDANGQFDPHVTALSGGGFLVDWTDTTDTSSTNFYYSVKAQRYDAQGQAVNADGSSPGAGQTFTIAANTATHSSVAALSSGGWVVSYVVNDDIYARVYDANGGGGSPVLVNTTTANGQDLPDVAALPDGGFVVSWQESSNDGDIYAQRFNAAGTKIGAELHVVSASGTQDPFPDGLAVLGNGDFASTWIDAATAPYPIRSIVFADPGDGGVGTATTLTTLNTTPSSDPSETFSYHITGFAAGTTFNYGTALSATEWVISSTSDINALKTNPLTATVPTPGTFTLTIDAQEKDTATLSTGTVTSTSHSTTTLVVGIKAAGDPVFAAHDAGTFDLHLSAITDGDTAHIETLPDNGQVAYADGTLVKAGETLSASQLAGLKFTPLDDGADHAANLIYSVSDGTSVDTQTLPIYVLHGSGLTLTGTADKDVIVGGHGNDTLIGNGGGNFLTGGAGADTFVFEARALADAKAAAPLVDHVTDYSAAHGDTLDFTSLFAGTSNPSAHAASLVHVTEEATGTSASVSVNVAGPNAAAHWVEIAHLDGVQAGQTVDVALDAAHPHQVSHLHVDGLAHA